MRTNTNLKLPAVAAALILLAAVSGHAAEPEHGKLVWSDEFNLPEGSGPDSAKWQFALGAGGWGNAELETYTKDPANCAVVSDSAATDGKALAITAIGKAGAFTSARIKTAGKFAAVYGLFEARMRLPRGKGVWPAFWLLGTSIKTVGWPKCGEIDAMENLGSDPTTVFGTLHGPGYSGGNGIQGHYQAAGESAFDAKYHVFAVRWSPHQIEWLVDGHRYQTLTPESLPKGAPWVFDAPFSIILNLAIGGKWPGYPTESNVFPQTMLVDYVRVYALPTR